MKIDNFALSMFQVCPSKFKLRMVDGWTTRKKSAALGFGGAFHEGLKTWYITGSTQAAIEAIIQSWPAGLPIDDWRTKEKCISVMLGYAKEYPIENFRVVGMPDSPMIECTFTLDTGMFLDCRDCGDPAGVWDGESPGCPNCNEPLESIEYGGIFDGLVEFSGSVYVLEHKTTSQLGSYYFNQFKPNNQVTGYVWAAQQLSGQRVGGAIVNAIGIYKSSPTKFERSITTRSDTEIAEWLINVRNSCQMIKDCERRGYFPMNTHSCTMYGQCEYHQVHTLGTEKERQAMLEMEYMISPWHYEARDDNAES